MTLHRQRKVALEFKTLAVAAAVLAMVEKEDRVVPVSS